MPADEARCSHDDACRIRPRRSGGEGILAVKNGDHANLVLEVADVLAHLAVIMVANGVGLAEVNAKLRMRAGGKR